MAGLLDMASTPPQPDFLSQVWSVIIQYLTLSVIADIIIVVTFVASALTLLWRKHNRPNIRVTPTQLADRGQKTAFYFEVRNDGHNRCTGLEIGVDFPDVDYHQ